MQQPRAFRSIVLAVLALAAGIASAATSTDLLWRDTAEASIARGTNARQIVPQSCRTLRLDMVRLDALLRAAPREEAGWQKRAGSDIQLPMANGRFQRFRFVESPIMAPELQEKYPEIRTYLGQGLDDPHATVRFDQTPKGFHAQIISAGETTLIDPYQPGDREHYISYRKRDYQRQDAFNCEVTGEPINSARDLAKHGLAKVSSGGTLRTYRLAMAATGEYTAFHGGTVVDGLAAIVSTMNRVNGIYEREVSVRMVLVANTDAVIFTNALTDPYTNNNGSTMLGQNVTTMNTLIGNGNFDVGHVVSTGGGGVAGLGVICSTSQKARGVTGLGAPVGDVYDVDYVAHEMGHQFSGNHTFNGSGVNCAGGNRNAGTAYEPGSGITIQAYAGICGGDDLQPHSEDYFHRVSLNEILAHVGTGSGSTCAQTSATGNGIPTVTSPGNFTIPGRTPFTLTASGTDPNGDSLTYVWEEFDLGAANAEGVLTDNGTSPIFRSYAPSADTSRTFPSWRYILNNANVPPTTTDGFFTGETLPATNRTLNFRVTVRDNRAGGGGTNEATSVVTVNNSVGPFAVTAPNTAISISAGTATTVTWNPANSASAPVINTTNVRITLSVDGGNTFDTVLAASTANDGSESVTIPAGLASTQARVKVEAIGNIYFDVSDQNFTITTAGNTPPNIVVTGSVSTRQGSPAATAVVASVSDGQDSAGSLQVQVSGAPPELSVSVSNVGGQVSLTATAACGLVAPANEKAYPVLLTVRDSQSVVSTATVNVNVSANLVPTLGNYANVAMINGANRVVAPSQLAADGNNNLANASIVPTVFPGGGSLAIASDGTVTLNTTAGTTAGTYNVRASVGDVCGAVETRQFAVTVGPPSIALVVESNVTPNGNGVIEPNECNDLNIVLRNNGTVDASNISAVLSTSTPNVTISQANSAYPDLPSGASGGNATPFQISTSNAATCFTSINLNLTVSYSGASGSPTVIPLVLELGRPLGTNYAFATASFTALPNDGTLLTGSQTDNGLADLAIPSGFSFSLYGTTYTGGTVLRASANGNLQFRPSNGATDADNLALPTPGAGTGQAVFPASAPTLFLQWDDWRMDGAAGGAAADAGIYTKLEGSAPNRRWIIEWRGRVRGDGAVSTNNNRAAIVFYENADGFDYVYQLTGVGAAAQAAGSTIGVQAASSGTRFTQFAANNANLSAGTRLTARLPDPICTAGSGACAVGPSVILTQSGGDTAVTEGGNTDTYTVVLSQQPSADVTVQVTGDTQVSAMPNSLVFTAATWNMPQTVTVSAVDDAVAEDAHTGTLTHAVSGGNYAGVTVPSISVAITDNDQVSVIQIESGPGTSVTEGGNNDSYTIALGSQPTGVVTINLTAGAQISLSPSGPLSFNASNWNQPQVVTVSAVDDAVVEGPHQAQIAHSVSGGGYDGLGVPSLVVDIVDNDGTVTDLSVSNSLLTGTPSPGQRITYEVAVDNLTAGANANSATFAMTLPGFLSNVSWVCTPDPGASCPASGNGLPSHSISLNGGTGVLYWISADVPGNTAEGTSIQAVASITAGDTFDLQTANNTASRTELTGPDRVFRDSFE